MIEGRATGEGTQRYQDRIKAADGHFRDALGLRLSSIGLGTYLGAFDDAADQRYREAIAIALDSGGNVFDTASNYRCQRSERAIGGAIGQAIEAGKIQRDEVFVATKGGFIAFDGAPPKDPRRFFSETFVEPGIATPDEIVDSCHVLTPRFVSHQIEQSRKNLGLATIDLYYVHNPETQLEQVSKQELEVRLGAVFNTLESAVQDGKISKYGLATWNAFRLEPGEKGALSLEKMVRLAERAGGAGHHFAAIQLPMNVAMPEAFVLPSQQVAGSLVTALRAARDLGLATFASASIVQAKVLPALPPYVGAVLKGLASNAQRALQFTRSTPGLDVALIGTGRASHARENFGLAKFNPASHDDFMKFFDAEGAPE